MSASCRPLIFPHCGYEERAYSPTCIPCRRLQSSLVRSPILQCSCLSVLYACHARDHYYLLPWTAHLAASCRESTMKGRGVEGYRLVRPDERLWSKCGAQGRVRLARRGRTCMMPTKVDRGLGPKAQTRRRCGRSRRRGVMRRKVRSGRPESTSMGGMCLSYRVGMRSDAG